MATETRSAINQEYSAFVAVRYGDNQRRCHVGVGPNETIGSFATKIETVTTISLFQQLIQVTFANASPKGPFNYRFYVNDYLTHPGTACFGESFMHLDEATVTVTKVSTLVNVRLAIDHGDTLSPWTEGSTDARETILGLMPIAADETVRCFAKRIRELVKIPPSRQTIKYCILYESVLPDEHTPTMKLVTHTFAGTSNEPLCPQNLYDKLQGSIIRVMTSSTNLPEAPEGKEAKSATADVEGVPAVAKARNVPTTTPSFRVVFATLPRLPPNIQVPEYMRDMQMVLPSDVKTGDLLSRLAERIRIPAEHLFGSFKNGGHTWTIRGNGEEPLLPKIPSGPGQVLYIGLDDLGADKILDHGKYSQAALMLDFGRINKIILKKPSESGPLPSTRRGHQQIL